MANAQTRRSLSAIVTGPYRKRRPLGTMAMRGSSGPPGERRWADMQWDLGLQGLGFLVVMSLGFGVIAQLVAGRAITRWLWLISAAAYFIGGLFASEVWFGWATEEDLQPNIDGLSFDEVLLVGLVLGIVANLVTRYVIRRRRRPNRTRLAH
jgi:hypothetical protein